MVVLFHGNSIRESREQAYPWHGSQALHLGCKVSLAYSMRHTTGLMVLNSLLNSFPLLFILFLLLLLLLFRTAELPKDERRQKGLALFAHLHGLIQLVGFLFCRQAQRSRLGLRRGRLEQRADAKTFDAQVGFILLGINLELVKFSPAGSPLGFRLDIV